MASWTEERRQHPRRRKDDALYPPGDPRGMGLPDHIVSETKTCWCGPVTIPVESNDFPAEKTTYESDALGGFAPGTTYEEAGHMRAFTTGATRNVEKDPDLYGFTSPLALGLFGEYMHRNRTQADGTVRDSDNWKKGIPLDSYIRSMRRHMQDLTLHHDGFPELAREDLEAAVCGLFFNVQGYMHEVMKQGLEEQRQDVRTFPYDQEEEVEGHA